MLITGEKKFIFMIDATRELQTHRGIIRHKDLVDLPWGSCITSHIGKPFLLLEPSLHDLLIYIPRKSQIIFPKDLGYILLRLSIGHGKRVIEAGTGSGALTMALAWAVGPSGTVFSDDRREDMQTLAYQNLARVGLENRVRFRIRDLADGFEETDADALFLDLPQPHLYLTQVRTALSNGGTLGAILPTSNQVSELLAGFRSHRFEHVEVCEILIRFYKAIPERLRPVDCMVAHTGYLVFARQLREENESIASSMNSGLSEEKREGNSL
jgi:tRNA (adenine57-N1/adenine58-N1)-methyltransferase